MTSIKLFRIRLTMIVFFLIFLGNIILGYSNYDTDLDIYSNNVIAIDFESGNVLYDKNGYKKTYPASTTKILTAILVIENLNLDESIVCSKNAVNSTPYGSSIMYLKVEEVMSIKNLSYGLMLQSGNDAGNVLAEAVSGSMDNFIILMNEKLKDIGCLNTHFTSAHGFHDDEHYTTAYDMAILMRYAMQNDTFREIIETKYIEIPATNKTQTPRKYYNTNRLLFEENEEMYYEYCVGGKTGYTEEARGTFVGYAKKDDKLVIVGTFDGSQSLNGTTLQARYLDSITLFDYAFDNYNRGVILSKDTVKQDFRDDKSKITYTISLKDNVYGLIKKDASTDPSYTLDVNNEKLNENTIIGDLIGVLKLNIINGDQTLINEFDLYCEEIVVDKSKSLAMYIITILFILFIVRLLKYKSKIKKRLKNRKKKLESFNRYNTNYSVKGGKMKPRKKKVKKKY